MDTKKINERKAIRDELLEELYNHNFENAGRDLSFEVDKFRQKDVEQFLALEYLIDKQLVSKKPMGANIWNCKITSIGIDKFEGGNTL